MKSWYLWKFHHSRSLKNDTHEVSDCISTVMNDTKRKIINSDKYRNVSRDFDKSNLSIEKENYSLNKSKMRDKNSKSRKKLADLSKYFSGGDRKPTPKHNFDAFIKNHNISDRDLIMAHHTIKSSTNGKSNVVNFIIEQPVNEYRDFDNSIDTSTVEIEELECIMVSDDSMFNPSHMSIEEHNTTEPQKLTKISRSKIRSKPFIDK